MTSNSRIIGKSGAGSHWHQARVEVLTASLVANVLLVLLLVFWYA